MNVQRSILVFFFATTFPLIQSVPQPEPSRQSNPPDSVSIHLSLQKSSYTVGEKPIAVMTIRDIGPHGTWISGDHHWERVYVTSKDGEPPKTELHRHLLGDVRPGDGPILGGSVVGMGIAAGGILSLKFDLTGYYDLRKPGDYSVYLEIYDPAGPKDGSGHWLRTNTAKFEVQAPAITATPTR